jgi:hypothetical protein
LYYDPDFDPSAKLPRVKGPSRDAAQQSRMMLPFSLKCSTCGHYMRLGKKFNATKETAIGMDYLTIKRFRFRFKCEACRAPISFLTDPKNADYECESGATRNYDFRKEQQQEAAAAAAAKAELTDGMSKLEARTLDSKREMEALDELDELQQQSHVRASLERRAAASAAALLAGGAGAERDGSLPDVDREEEDRLVAEAFTLKRSRVQRLDEEQDDDMGDREDEGPGSVTRATSARGRETADGARAAAPLPLSAKPVDELALPLVTRIVKRKKVVAGRAYWLALGLSRPVATHLSVPWTTWPTAHATRSWPNVAHVPCAKMPNARAGALGLDGRGLIMVLSNHGTRESQCKPVSPAVGCEAREAVGHVAHVRSG